MFWTILKICKVKKFRMCVSGCGKINICITDRCWRMIRRCNWSTGSLNLSRINNFRPDRLQHFFWLEIIRKILQSFRIFHKRATWKSERNFQQRGNSSVDKRIMSRKHKPKACPEFDPTDPSHRFIAHRHFNTRWTSKRFLQIRRQIFHITNPLDALTTTKSLNGTGRWTFGQRYKKYVMRHREFIRNSTLVIYKCAYDTSTCKNLRLNCPWLVPVWNFGFNFESLIKRQCCD